MVGALTAALLVGYAQYRSVWDSIHQVAITDLGKRPPKYNNALNILVFGTDSRVGLSLQQQIRLHVGPQQGEQNTDTIMLVHISPGRRRVTVLSLPRDTQVPYYACAAGPNQLGQQLDLSATEQINAVFAVGGISCLWKTVEHQTGIRIDHVIELEFTGFVKIIDDLGGVNVCVNKPVNDATSGLRLKAGVSHIYGVEALKFWRTREGIGTGSDLERIQRDQFMMASLLQGLTQKGVLHSPTRMLSLVKDVAHSMIIDSGMTQSDLLSIALSLKGLPPKSVQFITAPNMPDSANANWVDFEQPQADSVFSAIAHDLKLPKAVKRGKHGTHKAVTPLAKTAKPSAVHVEVLNGSGVAGQAAQVGGGLTNRGFDVVGVGSAANYSYTTSVIEYASAADLPAARTLKAQLSHVTLLLDTSATPGTLNLIVGSSFTALRTPSAAASQAVSNLSSRYNGITGSTSVCKDTSAFAGSLGY